MFGFDNEYPAGHPNSQILAIKDGIEKPILPNFVNLSTIFCPRLYEEAHVQNMYKKVLFFSTKN